MKRRKRPWRRHGASPHHCALELRPRADRESKSQDEPGHTGVRPSPAARHRHSTAAAELIEALAALNWLAVLAATAALYVLGGLWYSPALFGPRWRAGVGFVPGEGWKPGPVLYLAPLAGCFVTSLATALLVAVTDAHSAMDGIVLGLIVGLGYGAAIAGVDATAPSHPRPGALALIVGTYWTVGLTMVAVILSVWR